MKKLLLAGVCSALLLTTAGCVKDQPAPVPTGGPDHTSSSAPSSSPSSSTSSSPSSSPSKPAPTPTLDLQSFKVANYDFTYEIKCFCSNRSPITASVRDGKITKATSAKGEVINNGEAPQGPDLLTVNEMISAAEQVSARGSVKVDWPEGSPAPKTIFIDNIENAIDDEITYTITSFKEVAVG